MSTRPEEPNVWASFAWVLPVVAVMAAVGIGFMVALERGAIGQSFFSWTCWVLAGIGAVFMFCLIAAIMRREARLTKDLGVQSPAEVRKWRRWLIAYAVCFLLVVVGLFCWEVVAPVWRARRVVVAFAEGPMVPEPMPIPMPTNTRQCTQDLGGPRNARRELSRYLRMPDFLTTRRGAAARLLSACGPEAVPELIRCVRDRHENVRCWAVTALGDMKDPRAAEAWRAPCRTRTRASAGPPPRRWGR